MWQLDGTLASLQSQRWAATVDLRQPQLGLHSIHLSGAHGFDGLSDARLLSLTLPGSSSPEEIHDHWVRGKDLVVVYSATSRRASQPEIYWRSLESLEAVGLELIVSIKTDLLDDNPETHVVSELRADETWWLPFTRQIHSERQLFLPGTPPVATGFAGAGAFLVRLQSQVSYIEMIHPSDFSEAQVARIEKRVRIQTPLFPEHLEKGVIRRGRIRAWLVPSNGDLAAAHRLYGEFVDSELPLTT